MLIAANDHNNVVVIIGGGKNINPFFIMEVF